MPTIPGGREDDRFNLCNECEAAIPIEEHLPGCPLARQERLDKMSVQSLIAIPRPEPLEEMAINLFDMQTVDGALWAHVMNGRVLLEKTAVIKIDAKKPDEVALPFKCTTMEAAIASDIIRAEARKQNDRVPRIYVKKSSGVWWKMPPELHLTLVSEGKSYPNPAVFPSVLRDVEVSALKPRRVF